MTRPQNSDRLTLEETLDAMKRLGYTSKAYRDGYEDGFRAGVVANWSQEDDGFDYRRGHWQGTLARERGAHERKETA